MATETNKILQALLKQQGIAEFLPFEKPERCKLSVQLYGYTKEDKFHICDATLKEYQRKDISARIKGSLLIGKKDGQFYITDVPTTESLIISEDNQILVENPEEYLYLNTSSFVVGSKIELDHAFRGIVFNIKEYCHSIEKENPYNRHYDIFSFPDYFSYEEQKQLPKIELGNCPFINGILRKELRYLFTIGNNHYFLNIDTLDIMVSSEDGRWYDGTNYSIKADYIWFSDNGGILIRLEDQKNERTERTESIKAFINQSEKTVVVKNQWDRVVSFFNDRTTTYSSSQFFIAKMGYNEEFIIVINPKGEVNFSSLYENETIEFKNNILCIRSAGSEEVTFVDCGGKEFATLNRYEDYCRTEISIPNHTVFDHSDRSIYDKCRESYRTSRQIIDQEHTTSYQGLIEQRSGKTFVPMNFSGVITSHERDPFSREEYPSSKQVSIVWIDHFCNGKKSYYGLFTDDQLIIPIGYDDISFLQYDYYRDGEKESCRKENTQFIQIKKDGKVGLLDAWGREILPIEANSVRCLTKKSDSDYVIATDEKGYIRLIYKNKVISDYIYTKAEAIDPSEFGMYDHECEQLIKLYSEDDITFIYKGKVQAKFDFADISVHGCRFKTGTSSDEDNFVFLVEFDVYKGVFDSQGKNLLPVDEYNSIVIRNSHMEVDGIIYGDNLEEIIDTNKAELLNSARSVEGSVRVYYTEDEEYIIVGFNHWCIQTLIANSDSSGYSEDFFGLKYDFDNNEFQLVPDDDGYNHSDYPDDTDYERDTFYALGGDDYDSFKENGGNIDDMMDGMGY